MNITDNIADTLFINIKMKALEHELQNGILKDAQSARLYKELDYDFSKFPHRGASRIGVCVRARYFDEHVKDFIAHHQPAVVVFVGCGLDTRFFRINASESDAHFYELDLPEVIALRKQVLSNEAVQYIASSMFDSAWMDELKHKHENAIFLFVVEGVLMYFAEPLVKQFFIDLASRFNGHIICDLLSVWASKNSNKHDVIRKMSAKFKFGIDDLHEIENWHENIQLIKSVLVMQTYPERWGWLGKFLTLFPFIRNTGKLVSFTLKDVKESLQTQGTSA